VAVVSLVPSQYPADAVEFTVTFLIPVTEQNRQEVDGAVHDALNETDLTWWAERLAHFEEYAQVLRLDFTRPPEFVRPRPKRKKTPS
jgi:hypothetical protein